MSNFKKFQISRRGFTLIEILIALAIIAILLTVGILSFRNALRQGRDSEKKATIKEVQSALEAYYADHGRYPIHNNPPTTPDDAAASDYGACDPSSTSQCLVATNTMEVDFNRGHNNYQTKVAKSFDDAIEPYLAGGLPDAPMGPFQGNTYTSGWSWTGYLYTSRVEVSPGVWSTDGSTYRLGTWLENNGSGGGTADPDINNPVGFTPPGNNGSQARAGLCCGGNGPAVCNKFQWGCLTNYFVGPPTEGF
ncbi:MAG: prepilin-type N-terminal cleavage/methylation domain-containing protein [Candidatus Woykebacteria bacterium]